MAIQLNHTIVHAKDKHESARFLVEILGLPAAASSVRSWWSRLPTTCRWTSPAPTRAGAPAALRIPGRRGRIRRDLRADQGTRHAVLGRPVPPPARRDQP